MSCYKPLKAFRTRDGVCFSELSRYDIIGSIELPCGMCIGCRMRRASDWALRVQHEASGYDSNCFVTLTYGAGNVPAFGSLDHRDFQLFMKRLRKIRAPEKVRFYMCGEYGPKNGRPHYHACLFNVDFREDRQPLGKSAGGFVFYESAQLTELWGLGMATVQDLVPQTASYCARYIMKKQLGPDAERAYDYVDPETGEIRQRKAEYAAMSLKPGIGAAWFEKYRADVFTGDYVVADGLKHQTPRFYDRLFKRLKLTEADEIEYKRQIRARENAHDNTDERRRAREIVHEAKVSTLARNDL